MDAAFDQSPLQEVDRHLPASYNFYFPG